MKGPSLDCKNKRPLRYNILFYIVLKAFNNTYISILHENERYHYGNNRSSKTRIRNF